MATARSVHDGDAVFSAVQEAAELIGRHVDPHALRDAVGDGSGETATQQIVRGLESLELSTRSHESSPVMLFETAPPDSPWIVCGGSGGPIVLRFGARRARARMKLAQAQSATDVRWLDADGLTAALGLSSSSTAIDCISFEPRSDKNTAGGGSRDAHGGDESETPPLRALIQLLAEDKADIGVVVIYGVAVGIFALVTPLAAQSLVSTVAFGTLLQPIIVLGTMVLGFLLASAFLRTLQAWVVEILQRRLFVRAACTLAERLPRLDLAAGDATRHVETRVPRLLEVVNAQKSTAILLLDGLEGVLTTVVGLVLLAFYHPMLLAFDLLLLVGVAVIIGLIGRSGVATSIDESESKYRLLEWLETVASRPHSLRNHGGPAFAMSRADAATRAWLQTRSAHFDIIQRQRVAALGLQAAASAGLLVVGGYLVVDAQLTLGQLVAAELIVTAVAAALAKIAKHADAFYDLVAAAVKLQHLQHLPTERSSGDTRALGVGQASLSIEEVSFSNGERYDLEVRPGEHIVIRDEDGVASRALLVAFGTDRSSSGTVKLDGLDVTTMHPQKLRERMALVREPEIWPASVLDNVRFGRPEISVRAIHDALARLGGLNAQLRKADGLARELFHADAIDSAEAVVIAIARATVSSPGLLVLDGTLDRLADDEAQSLIDALTARDVPWTLIVRTRMSLAGSPVMGAQDARRASLPAGRVTR